MARVKLIQNREDVAPEHQPLFEELAALRGRISGPSTVILHSPGLARPWNEISEFLHRGSVVEARLAELAVATTAREYDCSFVWNAHVGPARRAGAADASLDAVAHRRDLEGLPPDEATVIRFVRGLLQTNRVDEDVFDALLAAHGARWLVELTAWIGRYGALSGVLNSFEVDIAANAERLPASKGQHPGATRPVQASPRLRLITSRDQANDEAIPVFDAINSARGGFHLPHSILIYSPPLCQRMFDVNTYLLRVTTLLEAPFRELAILATAREYDCPYVWNAHAPLARESGFAEDAIAAVRDRADAKMLLPAQRDLLDYVRQVLVDHVVAQELFERLVDTHGVPWLVELTALIGHYGMIAAVLNAFEVAPPAGAEPL